MHLPFPSLFVKGLVSNLIIFVAFLEADEIRQQILPNFLQGYAQARETIKLNNAKGFGFSK
jgi:hypothetical protein